MISDEYAAGFFDGEGCVYVAHRLRKKEENFSPTSSINVCIANTVIGPLEEFEKKWGGSIRGRFETDPRRRKQYQWVLATRMALPFLRAIYPHVIIKKMVVAEGIKFCELMELPKEERIEYTGRVFRRGREWVCPRVRPEFREKIDQIRFNIRSLNSSAAPGNALRQYTL